VRTLHTILILYYILDVYYSIRMPQTYHIINMQCNIGQPHPGVAISNTQLMELFPKEMRRHLDIQQISKSKFEEFPSEVLLKCIESQRRWPRTLFFGGDHFASFFTVLSSLVTHGNKFRLIWLDAHGDIHNMRTSPSGNRHGMPVRLLMEHTIPGIPRLQPYQILYIGIRDLERAEWNYIARRKIRYIKAADVAASIPKIAKFVSGRAVHMSLDVDVLDPEVMPCTGTLAPDGLSLETLRAVFDTIREHGNIVAIDAMEYNPTLGKSSEEKKVAKQTMRTIVSKIVEF